MTLEKKPFECFCCLAFILLLSIKTVVANEDRIKQSVAADIKLHKSFMALSDRIKQRGTNEFTTIGADGACDFNAAFHKIQDVIDTGVAEIRVASNANYLENITLVNQDIVIRGGFANCTEAENNNQVFSDITVIDGSAAPAPVIHISGKKDHTIRLENLGLTGGSAPQSGGGLLLDKAHLELQLLRVALANNIAPSGGGIAVYRGFVTLYGQDVVIIGNESTSTTGGGGGLFCDSVQNRITLTGLSLIANNKAVYGGGIMLRPCRMSMYSSNHPEVLSVYSGIIANQSTKEGGGAYLRTRTELNLFGQRMCDGEDCLGSNSIPIFLSDNQSDEDASGGEPGGGLYLSHDLTPPLVTRFYANGLVMEDNRAGGYGGGAYIKPNTEVIIDRVSKNCWNLDRCNHIINNRSGSNLGFGGAFHVEGGTLKISHAYLEENRADFGTAINASGDAAIAIIENSVFNDNGDDGSDGFSDTQVIRASLGAQLSIHHSTIADNNITNSTFDIGIAGNSSLLLTNSIVHDPGPIQVFAPAQGQRSIDCVIAHENNSFTGTNIFVANPKFVDRSTGNFHIQATSPAIDLCAQTPMEQTLDADWQPRGWDDPVFLNGSGSYDAGADETYLNDVIFKDSFDQ